MRATKVIMKNWRYIKDVELPLYKELNQVYVPDKKDAWDIMVGNDIIFMAIAKNWTNHVSNVCTEEMTMDSEVSAIFMDDDFHRLETGELIPYFYKTTMKKVRPEVWSCEIKIEYFRSEKGEDGPWIPENNALILKKIKHACEDVIYDDEENSDRIMIPEHFLEEIIWDGREYRADIASLIPWMILDERKTYGNTIVMRNIYEGVESQDIIDEFNDYIESNCEGKYIQFITSKENELNMNRSAR